MSKVNSAIAGAGAGFSAGGPIGAAIGGVGGYLLGQDDNSQSYFEQMLKEAQSIPLPQLKELNPELYKIVASMNPELTDVVNLGPSAMEGISLDPKYKAVQMAALDKLMNISDNNGKDAQFLADSSRLVNDVNSNLKGNSDAITQNMAVRGMSGGMGELLNKQLSAQQGADRHAQLGLDLNAQAQQRALDALINGNNVASQMSQNEFGQKAQVAGSQDAISRFNAQNLQDVRNNNVNIKNNAQQFNAQNAQNISNQNVGLNNQAQQYNLNLPQQQFENELRKKGMISSGYGSMAENNYRQSKDQD